jgi:heat shock protein HslJ
MFLELLFSRSFEKLRSCVILLVLVCTGCESATQVGDLVPSQVYGVQWQAVLIEDMPVASTTEVWIRFSGDKVTGFDGCNGFGGNVSASESKMRIILSETLTEGCPQADALELSRRTRRAVLSTHYYSIEGEHLVFLDEERKETARFKSNR